MVKSKALRRWLDHTHDQRRVNIVKQKIHRWHGPDWETWVDERLAKNPKSFLDMWYHRGFRDMSEKARSREEVRKMLRNFEEEEK